jgi:hypothetical protein
MQKVEFEPLEFHLGDLGNDARVGNVEPKDFEKCAVSCVLFSISCHTTCSAKMGGEAVLIENKLKSLVRLVGDGRQVSALVACSPQHVNASTVRQEVVNKSKSATIAIENLVKIHWTALQHVRKNPKPQIPFTLDSHRSFYLFSVTLNWFARCLFQL